MVEAGGRRIAIVGTINRDTIRTPDGVETESFGGILYSILPLDAIIDEMATIYPVVNVGEDMQGVVEGILSGCRGVSHDAIRIVPHKNPHCFLDYDEGHNKQETLIGGVPKLTLKDLEPYLACDAIVVNFITGMELELETLQAAREAATATIFMDIHSLTLGMDDQHRRFWRVPFQWEAWTACADVVQMNEKEAELLSGSPLTDHAATLSFGRKLIEGGSQIVMVTRGDRGSDAMFRDGDGNVTLHHSPSQPAGAPQDETGCGDVYMMGFAWSFLEHRDPVEACRYANMLAGINVTLRGIDGVQRIGEELKARAASG